MNRARIEVTHRLRCALLALAALCFTVPALAEGGSEGDELLELSITGLVFDNSVKSPVVILHDKGAKRDIPIWIGMCEARSIELGIAEIIPPRPLTYDLFAALLRTLDAKVERVVIVDLRDKVFYARVELTSPTGPHTIDARPSDALALAARMGSPIFIKRSVAEKSTLGGKGAKRDL